ncbi:unnamed protein product [Tilletia controversa]|nr:unnamed protein product [Tilletia controversa]CAD6929946.1 unnamed protein product [Tilletia caries]CAD6974497.1 unnamed protein product [Tilletia controversa]CAD7063579.1 unnamed protein product [Tilletia caries]
MSASTSMTVQPSLPLPSTSSCARTVSPLLVSSSKVKWLVCRTLSRTSARPLLFKSRYSVQPLLFKSRSTSPLQVSIRPLLLKLRSTFLPQVSVDLRLLKLWTIPARHVAKIPSIPFPPAKAKARPFDGETLLDHAEPHGPRLTLRFLMAQPVACQLERLRLQCVSESFSYATRFRRRPPLDRLRRRPLLARRPVGHGGRSEPHTVLRSVVPDRRLE